MKTKTPGASIRTGTGADDLRQAFLDNLVCALGRLPSHATSHDHYLALALTVRDHVMERGVKSFERGDTQQIRRVAYLSAEFLPGPHLGNHLLNLGLTGTADKALDGLGIDLDQVLAQEQEPGLGNGGLGRLASCYLDSLATVGVQSVGYGIRYEFGIFDQTIRDGWQVEVTDKWLHGGNPWEVYRPGAVQEVKFGGHTEVVTDAAGRSRVHWVPAIVVRGEAYDTPISGFDSDTCALMRLWKSEAVESFDFEAFNHGDYDRAVEQKVASENLSKVLYPNDELHRGKELRLKQQYFFTSCALQDMLRIQSLRGSPPDSFHRNWAVQLNDTHPAIAVAELMRLLVDVHALEWDAAWSVTRATLSYTNHTLLPEALERWPVDMLGGLLPRHLEIIYEINAHFLDEVRAAFPGDDERLARLSLIDESGLRYVRMANLACVGSQTVNGVAELHSELLRQTVLVDFAALWPDKFTNVTNGVTPRRFVALANPGLGKLLTKTAGKSWPGDLDKLRKIEPHTDDPRFRSEWREVKLSNKRQLAALIAERTGIEVAPESLFDVQVKRIHEYKRQHLNLLHVLTLYLRLKRDPKADIPARTFIFGGKAAPGYFLAKRIIRLATAASDLINNDRDVAGRIKVVFFPDFNVRNAQSIYPAADLSEQVSLAGMEASGTGNMKMSLNGALTIGTLDGANVEIREAVGAENFFLFGLNAGEVVALKRGGYRPRDRYDSDPLLREVIDFIGSGALGGDVDLFQPLVANLLDHDPYLLLADYRGYLNAQQRVSELWMDPEAWTRASILNTARMGRFSSDRSIRDYCQRVWNVNIKKQKK
ncbi:glycogen/starch/alpha-glucan phosphorylase [Luteolibacter arcticus]|uniref:Alpha-1,4 glucan phosphorylase n=1 Tax=Luteolibacter arcticus TaxID=1581411 RepID=A0ABT3GCA9_9BACT|nr:glycogen/starch/alpha-glucan phosphorylase [Luteolibacter arcticus]MCW1921267.1 glycogen/starch/alpha-glucan phosphorylase [Luteolibacter arcticus]